MGTGTGWKALQQRRQEAMRKFDVEVQARVMRMVEAVPRTISSFGFPDSFMTAMRKAWEKWLVEPPFPQTDLVVRVNANGIEYCTMLRQEEDTLQRAWKTYARVRVLPTALYPGDVTVEITLL